MLLFTRFVRGATASREARGAFDCCFFVRSLTFVCEHASHLQLLMIEDFEIKLTAKKERPERKCWEDARRIRSQTSQPRKDKKWKRSLSMNFFL